MFSKFTGWHYEFQASEEVTDVKIEQTLAHLSALTGISGHEQRVAQAVAELYRPFVDEVRTDALGNVIAAKYCGKPGAKRLMLDAHTDEIGLMVTSIDEKGFLHFCPIGGVDERILPASEVMVHGSEEIPGVIGIKPPHIQTDEEMGLSLGMDDLAIDIGRDVQTVHGLVSVGDSVTFVRQPETLGGGQFCGKSLDDRASVTALLYAAEILADKDLSVDVFFVSSVQEETGLAGALTASYGIDPDYALVIDVTHGNTPDYTDAFDVGGGPAFSLGPNVAPKLAELLQEIGKEKDIALHPEVDGGSTGTNAWAVQVSREGVATAVMSIPLKYMHTPVEVISAEDVRSAGELAAAFARALER